MDFYGTSYPKSGKKGSRPAEKNDPRCLSEGSMPNVAPNPSNMRSSRSYPGKSAKANYGKLFTRTASKYGVDGV